ncbi:putative transposase [Pseudarthrobacter sp. S9]|uniref:putative transposase n=3 Tax=Pseudarthrobacter sp. S9 TaxID=3418421 RepID=UPI003CFF6C56
MTEQPPLPLCPPEAVELGAAAVLEDETGGRVYLFGVLSFQWDAGDETGRRLAAVQLLKLKAAPVAQVAAAFGTAPGTAWRWRKDYQSGGTAALVPEKPGPRGPSRLTDTVVAEILRRRADGQSLRAIGAATGLSTTTVMRALEPAETAAGQAVPEAEQPQDAAHGGQLPGQEALDLPVLPAPADRTGERAAARTGLMSHAEPVFAPAARVPLAGLFLALPALASTGLLACANEVYRQLAPGFYGLETVLLDAVFRALAGEPRAEGATRFDPHALGRILGMDRAPEVKTIRRKFAALAETGKAAELITAMASRHLSGSGPDGEDLAALLYVDGHVRAYHGTRKIAKQHSTRLKFPAPATLETWVSDAAGDPVMVVLAEPGASLAMELRRLLPTLRDIVGNDRRVLVGFDRGGWSPALFKHMAAKGFDTLTWRKGTAEDLGAELFGTVTFTDPETGLAHAWEAADALVDLPVGEKKDAEVFGMRQITRLIDNGKGAVRQIHLLTTRTDLTPGELLFRMGSRWRQENHFRYARMHFDLDSQDAYAVSDDDAERMVPNPAKKIAHATVVSATARHAAAKAATDAALLTARTPANGHGSVLITNEAYNLLTAPLRQAEQDLDNAQAAHRAVPARLRLGDIAPAQKILDTETKLLTHAVKIAAFNTVTALARDVRMNTGYARASDEAHALIRQMLVRPGDIRPAGGHLEITLDPLPTARATKAAAELCDHLTATETVYPGTSLVLQFGIKNRH